MSELADAKAKIRSNERKIRVLEVCAEKTRKDLLRFAHDMHRAGHTDAEICQAIEATRPIFEEAARAAMRAVTIGELLMSASDG